MWKAASQPHRTGLTARRDGTQFGEDGQVPKVYVANKSPHDFSKAERFGDLHFVMPERVNIYRTSDMFVAVERALRDSQPTDRIVISGLPIALAILTAEFARRHGRLNLLLFNGEDYEAREIIMAR